MPEITDFDELREISRTHRSAVSEARLIREARRAAKAAAAVAFPAAPAVSARARVALIKLRPPAPRGPLRQAWLLALRSALAAQEKLAAASPHRWAPVLASGEDRSAATAWVVEPFYRRTLKKFADTRPVLPLPALHALAQEIISALEELEKLAARPHGALSLGNIYIGGDATLAKSDILLSTPAPLAVGLTAHAARLADNRALGTILASLIRRREQVGSQVEDGPEWVRFGKLGQQWRSFCNFLLDPHPAPVDTTVAALRQRFDTLGGRGTSTSAKLLLVLAPLLIAAAPFAYLRFAPFDSLPLSAQEFAIKLGNLPPDAEEVPPEHAALCDAWNDWFGAFCAEMERNDGSAGGKIRDLWATDPALRDAAEATLPGDALDLLDPRRLNNDPRGFEPLRNTPPASAKRGLVVRRTIAAARSLAALGENLAKWDDGQRLVNAAAATLAEKGFTTAAADLRLKPLPALADGTLPAEVTRRLRLLATARATTGTWEDLAPLAAALAASGDPVLAALADETRAALATTPLATLPAQIAAAAPVLRARAAFIRENWTTQIDLARWVKEGFPKNFSGKADAAALARWDADVKGYFRIPAAEDPRNTVNWETRTTRLATEMQRYADADSRLYGAPVESPALAAETAKTLAAVKTFRTTSAIRKDAAALRERTSALDAQIEKILAAIAEGVRDLEPDAAGWLARARTRDLEGPRVPAAEWLARRNRFLAGETPEKLTAEPARFNALRAAYRKTRDILGALHGETLAGGLAPLPAPLPAAEFAAAPAASPDAAAFAAAAAQTAAADAAQVALLYTDLIKLIPFTPAGAPTITPETYAAEPAVKTRLDALRRWRADAANAAALFARLSRLLDKGGALGDADLTAVATALDANTAAKDIAAAGLPAVAFAALRQMRTLAAANEHKPLHDALAATTDRATVAPFGVALTAWRRLGTLGRRLENAAALDAALVALDTLTAKIPAEMAPASAARLRSTFASDAKLCWREAYATAPLTQTPDILTRLTKAGLTPADLKGLDRFDALLVEAKKTRWARLSEPEAKQQRNTLAAKIRETLKEEKAAPEKPAAATAAASSAPATTAAPAVHNVHSVHSVHNVHPSATAASPADRLSRLAAATAFLAAIEAIDLEPSGKAITPESLGPGLAGWSGTFAADKRRIAYTRPNPRGGVFTQDYLLVEPEDGVPFFLAARAISLGDFTTLVETDKAGAEVLATMPKWVGEVSGGLDTDSRAGPQTWRVLPPRRPAATRLNDSRMIANHRWTAYLDPRWPDPLYAPGLPATPAPTPRHPVQNIPPSAARLFAEKILGARLASPDEWRGVASAYPALAKPDAPGANFSDNAWRTQRDHIAKSVRGGDEVKAMPWPDSGAFQPTRQLNQPAPPSGAAAQPYNPNKNDGHLWFAEVGEPNGKTFVHLFGNVATWLYEPTDHQYAVAGGSALSPATLNPTTIYPADPFSEGFADVGLRPAFDASPAMLQRGRLVRALSNQPYLHQPAPPPAPE
jgi:hypothetical protein